MKKVAQLPDLCLKTMFTKFNLLLQARGKQLVHLEVNTDRKGITKLTRLIREMCCLM
jgi:hypothetical protein